MKKKVVTFVGDKGVGKSSIISQIVYKVFPQTVHFDLKDICRFQREDSVYEFRYIPPTPNHLSSKKVFSSDMIVYVYSWDNPASYRWVETSLCQHPRGIPIIVVCNKVDLIGEMGQSLLCDDSNEQQKVFVSAKEGTNISNLFAKIHSYEANATITMHKNSCCVLL